MRSEIAWLTRAVPTASNGFIAAIRRNWSPAGTRPSRGTWISPSASTRSYTISGQAFVPGLQFEGDLGTGRWTTLSVTQDASGRFTTTVPAPLAPRAEVFLTALKSTGEYYYVEHQPGQGVASVGLEDGLPVEEQTRRETVREQIF